MPTSQRVHKKVAAYSLALATTPLINEAANGAVVNYSPPGGPIVLQTRDDDYIGPWLDINSDGVDDFELLAYFTFFLRGPLTANATLMSATQTLFAENLSPGETVEPSAGTFGHFPRLGAFVGTRGYAGIVFDIPGGSPHYGYLDFSMTADGSQLTLHGGAYESLPNTPILAGAVPEPNSLALLAGGAAALATWRRRKLAS